MSVHSQVPDFPGVDAAIEPIPTSRTRFYQRFSREIGTPPGTYMRQRRLLRAALLLVWHVGRTIDDIADSSGYSSNAALCQAFRREIGATPGQVRQHRDELLLDCWLLHAASPRKDGSVARGPRWFFA